MLRDNESRDKGDAAGSRNRAATEARLLEATRQLVERDGILAGLNLKEVSELSGVNRGLIYQYFGSRQGLLRAALGERDWLSSFPFTTEGRSLPFRDNRMMAFSLAVGMASYVQLEALRAIDRDESLQVFPRVDELREHMKEQQAVGAVDDDLDPMAAYIATTALFRGYAIFREAFARQIGVGVSELDAHVAKVVERMVSSLSQEQT